MIRSIGLVAAILAAGPAHALSCAAPSVLSAYQTAHASPVDYSVALGSLTTQGPSNPPGGPAPINGDLNNMAGYTQPAFFEGAFFSGTAFDLTRSANVTIEVTCTGPWCGGFADVENALIFLRRDGGGTYTFEASPCPGWVFYDPTPADLQTVVTCFANGGC